MAKSIAISTFEKLIKDFVKLYQDAKNALALCYFQMGKKLIEVDQNGHIRAHYGDGLLEKISEELTNQLGKGFSVNNLERMRKFYLENQKSPAPGKLDWTQFVELMPVENEQKRRELEVLAKKENLSSRELRELVKKENEKKTSEAQSPIKKAFLKLPASLQLNTYRKITDSVVELAKGEILVDLGFYVYRNIGSAFDGNFLLTEKPSYTYPAVVEKVVDGDTIVAFIEIGFGTRVKERLRFRGIDTPELKTAEGEKAKRFVSGLLTPGKEIVIKTYKNDIYGRFVVDVFYLEKADAGPQEIVESGIFLNQQLLKEGLAKRLEM